MKYQQEPFGFMPDGQRIYRYSFEDVGIAVRFLNLGATIQSICVPDKNGRWIDVCLGYESGEDYIDNPCFLGSVIGRHANRIKGASFALNGRQYTVTANEGGNQLHGGAVGFHQRLWEATHLEDGIRFTLHSPDGEEGFPGNLDVSVEYHLICNLLFIRYQASSDADTVVNLTNHTYYNLSGEGSGSILDHSLRIYADAITENDAENCPTGVILPVDGTPFDFREMKRIQQDIFAPNEQLQRGSGYDHNYVLGRNGEMKCVAEVKSHSSGIHMTVSSTQPGVQFYSGNHLSCRGKHDYQPREGFCLETQHYPNSMQHPAFPTVVLKKGETYQHGTLYRFFAEGQTDEAAR